MHGHITKEEVVAEYEKLVEFTTYVLGKVSKWSDIPEDWYTELQEHENNARLYKGG